MTVDYRKLLIAQMLECSAFDGGWPFVNDGLTDEERAAYEEADQAAHVLDAKARDEMRLHKDLGSVIKDISPPETPLMALLAMVRK